MQESLTKKTFKAFFWQFGGTIFKAFFQIGILFLLARMISKGDFGIMQSAIIVMGLAQLLSQMGVGPALVQIKNLSNLHIRTGLIISLSLSFLLFLIIFLLSKKMALFFRMPELEQVLNVVSFIFIFEGITTISQSLLLREMRQKTLVIIDIISYAAGYGFVSIYMALKGYGYWSLVAGQMVQSFLMTLFSYGSKPHSIIPYWGSKEMKELLYFGGGFTLAKFFNYLAGQGDKIIAGRYLGSVQLGIYSNAYSLMVQPASLLGNSIDKAIFPAMSSRQEENNKLIKAFTLGATLITFFAIPLSLILVLSAKAIIFTVLGEKWAEAVIPFQILALVLVFRVGYKMGDSLCRATGRVYERALVQLIYAILMIVGTYIGARTYGITGVAIGASLAITLNYILMINLSLKILRITWGYYINKTLLENFLPIIFIMFIYGLCFQFSKILFVSLTAKFFGGIIMFLFVIYILYYFFFEKIDFLKDVPYYEVLLKFARKHN